MLTRRDLLKGIIATASAPAVIKLERLMRIKTIVPPELAMFHVIDECSFLSTELITREALKILSHNLMMYNVNHSHGIKLMNHTPDSQLKIHHPKKFTIEGIYGKR